MRHFEVSAVDDGDGEHVAQFGDWRWKEGEGWGDVLLWPPVGPGVRRLRVQVSTLWEAAWAEIELPGR